MNFNFDKFKERVLSLNKSKKKTPKPNEKRVFSFDKFQKGSIKEVKKNKIKKTDNFWKFFLRTVGFLFGVSIDLFLIVALAGITVFLYAYYNTVDAEALTKIDLFQTTIIYDKTGEHILYELYGEENRKVVSHEEISDYMRDATIAAEDDDFYNHIGIDVFGIARAAYKNFAKKTKSQGGSTITQQLVKNKFLTNEKTYDRKFKEIVLAIKMERHYKKSEILDFYLNEVPYGSNAYGVQKAAEIFFGKNAKDLTLDEAALLASLPKATSNLSPYGKNKDALVSRQKEILNRMAELDMYDKDFIDSVLKVDTLAKIQKEGYKQKMDVPHFVFYVKEELEKQFSEEKIRQGGFSVYTTLDYDMQKRAEQDVKDYVPEIQKNGASNAALVAVDPKTGGVLAMVGSVDFYDEANDGKVNVTTSLRQPGSSFKPIVYAAAFDKGYQPETLLYDVPTVFGKDGEGVEYKPNNYDLKTHGLVSMRKALAGSLNIPAVKTLYLVGVNDAIDFAETLGISTLEDRDRFGLSLVLGAGEVKLVELVGAYAVFANDGEFAQENDKAKVHGIARVIDDHGKEVYQAPQVERIINADVARKVNSILSDNDARSYVFGRNNNLYFKDRKVAAKTGTTQNSKDVLTLGFTPDIAVGVWIGNNTSDPLKEDSFGSHVAAPLWRKFIERELTNFPETSFIDYEPNTSIKSMVTGFMNGTGASEGGGIVYYNKKTGERISAEKARKMDPSKLESKYDRSFGHSILYYVDKDNPLDPTAKPDYNNEMLWRWEKALGHSTKKPSN